MKEWIVRRLKVLDLMPPAPWLFWMKSSGPYMYQIQVILIKNLLYMFKSNKVKLC